MTPNGRNTEHERPGEQPDTRQIEVWKATLRLAAEQEFDWPVDAKILHVAMQGGEPRVWFQFDPYLYQATERRTRRRRILLAPTGGAVTIGLDTAVHLGRS